MKALLKKFLEPNLLTNLAIGKQLNKSKLMVFGSTQTPTFICVLARQTAIQIYFLNQTNLIFNANMPSGT